MLRLERFREVVRLLTMLAAIGAAVVELFMAFLVAI